VIKGKEETYQGMVDLFKKFITENEMSLEEEVNLGFFILFHSVLMNGISKKELKLALVEFYKTYEETIDEKING